ncbi:DMT family transporter [Tropicibacter sp. R16_0]|uniref:DMT family transporter n=1 Tax=Tropicibacter sp. R16_0 TaxID=2821102 RepID=UPI001ADD1EAC|nr:DMT family transporter [Tropicibacter sp. R16_0]MBO9450702.1 DMT family transporter [Tropicibacter sp. R16_0]
MIALLILAVILGGALIAAQGPIYTRMAELVGGPLQTAALAFGLGTLSLLMLLIATNSPLPRRSDIASVPLWMWAGGLIGVYVVVVSILAVPRLGVASYMVCVIVGQLAAGYVYDRTGAFGMEMRDFSTANLIGLGLVAFGAGLTVWR